MKKLKESRAASFIVIAAIYIFASAAGVTVYMFADPLEWWLSLLLADIASTVFVFIFSMIFRNASVYDPYWSIQPMVIAAAFSLGTQPTLLGGMLVCTVFIWGLRLTANWAYTFRNLEHQDWRYTMLSEKTGKLYPVINFIGIHLVPTLIVWGCILPAVYAIGVRRGISPYSMVQSPWSFFFCSLSLAAVLLQAVSDVQMHKYRKNRTTPFIRTGMWKHSRHPNYLGEILMWWGVALAVTVSYREVWYLSLGALANTLLFLLVSIPMADGRQAKKDGYTEYKSETRMLLPIPRLKKDKQAAHYADLSKRKK